MSKAPAFQFYTGDWIQDTRCLSLAAKGAWIDLLCAMWRSQTRGKLSFPLQGYARLIGATVDQTKAVIDELIDMRICDREIICNGQSNDNVTLVNRRMVKEERERELTRCRVEKHRNAPLKRENNAESNAKITHLSSSSTSTSKKKNNKHEFVLPAFISREIWDEYLVLRKSKKAPNTPYALSLIVKKIIDLQTKHGQTPQDTLNKSIERGWVGVFEINQGGNGGSRSNAYRTNIRGHEVPDESERINAEWRAAKAVKQAAADKARGASDNDDAPDFPSG